ncbi:putative transmembrane protein [Rhodopirellula islandica]|uniref:Transmembrane protein n=1 Tax=Rhodopirellula islandica TaxID=595434 RepID=A0A0J1BA16_RHOIS|nr:hypothetical protein [Rhodopirellula islandica]KLU03368.1 putative transmembrane protein [Rhodopirellula islandica]
MNRSPKRHAHSLVELMIVLSVLSSLITVSVGWIHQSMKLSKQMHSRQAHQTNLTRLTRMIRDDARAASEASVDGSKLTLASLNVVYQVNGPIIQRTEQIDASTTRTDVFELQPGSRVIWNDTELPQAITLQIKRSSGTPIPSRLPQTNESNSPNSDTTNRNDLHLRMELNRYARFGVKP